eukprot:3245933-Pyramimonas_sp.AAC.1
METLCHDEGETVGELVLNRAELVVVLFAPPHLAHAVRSGILWRHEGTKESIPSSPFAIPRVLVGINLGLSDNNGPCPELSAPFAQLAQG